MPVLVVLLLCALLLFTLGFAFKLLWWAALAAFVLWLIGSLRRGTSTDSSGRSRHHR
ncbi:hydrophobic protein [Kitasatospora paranensis]|uniref:Hydrophobic protein n=1 Tax=Kitasatospora paranensis TaxID=258053 RepID=A0ABW2G8E8_9ACTN